MSGLLLDTHVAIWVIEDSPRLGSVARSYIDAAAGRCYHSVVSLWEVAVKRAVHPEAFSFTAKEFAQLCDESGLAALQLKSGHIFAVDAIPLAPEHRDPYDRLLLAQARMEGLTLLTHDRAFEYDGPHGVVIV